MTYKDVLKREMERLAQDSRVVFIGYNTAYGHQMNGTLTDVPKNKLIETPVAENLMTGLAIGMALEGHLPVLCFERMDFMWIACDAIVNHIDKLPMLSGYKVALPMIIRCMVGNATPLDPGPQHTQDLTDVFEYHTDLRVVQLLDGESIEREYNTVITSPRILVEYRELYSTPVHKVTCKRTSRTPSTGDLSLRCATKQMTSSISATGAKLRRKHGRK